MRKILLTLLLLTACAPKSPDHREEDFFRNMTKVRLKILGWTNQTVENVRIPNGQSTNEVVVLTVATNGPRTNWLWYYQRDNKDLLNVVKLP